MEANGNSTLPFGACEAQLSGLLRRKWPRTDPEIRKLVGRMYAGTHHARRLEAAGRFNDSKRTRLNDLLTCDVRQLDLDLAIEIADCWDQLLIEAGDAHYLCTLLEAEYARVPTGTTVVTWRTLYGSHRLPVSEKFRRGETIGEGELAQARNRLAALYRTRVVLYALYRARLVMKSQLLWSLLPMLLALTGALAIAAATRPDGGWADVALAAAAGAVGATLSGTYKLRDHVEHINALREFKPAFAVQPLLGAAAGLFLLLVLTSRFLEVNAPGPGWATIGMVAFVAGFSEPFVLGVVQRIAGIADVKDDKEAAERVPVQPAGDAEENGADESAQTDTEKGTPSATATAVDGGSAAGGNSGDGRGTDLGPSEVRAVAGKHRRRPRARRN